MKINIAMGFFLPVPPVAGGAMEKAWFRLGREFVAAGHTVTLLSRCWPGFPVQETIDGVAMIRAPGFNHTRRLTFNLLLDGLWGLRLLRHLPAADITACNNVSLPIHLPWLRPQAGRVDRKNCLSLCIICPKPCFCPERGGFCFVSYRFHCRLFTLGKKRVGGTLPPWGLAGKLVQP